MRCGICGKDGTDRTMLKLRSFPYDLNEHTRNAHPAEYQAAIAARRTKAQTARQTKAVEAQRVSDARLAASRPVVIRFRGEGESRTCPSSKVARHEVRDWNDKPMTHVRFPDAEAYQQYERIMVTIAGLEAGARELLTLAWEMGRPVTLAHLDELDRAAIALASPQTKEDEA